MYECTINQTHLLLVVIVVVVVVVFPRPFFGFRIRRGCARSVLVAAKRPSLDGYHHPPLSWSLPSSLDWRSSRGCLSMTPLISFLENNPYPSVNILCDICMRKEYSDNVSRCILRNLVLVPTIGMFVRYGYRWVYIFVVVWTDVQHTSSHCFP